MHGGWWSVNVPVLRLPPGRDYDAPMPETGQTLSVFVSVDMEGVAGITTQRQCTRGTDDYAWARRLMTQEASAAAAGAVDAGYLHVTVSDSHGDMGNILPHEMDSRAELVQGGPKTPWSMMTGLDDSFMCAAFVGYHAGAGTARGVLDHTFTGWFADVRVNDEPWDETRLNAALAGTFGVPIVFVAGDEACCEQAKEGLPWVRTVATKRAFGSRSARSLSPARSQAAIRGILRRRYATSSKRRYSSPKVPTHSSCR